MTPSARIPPLLLLAVLLHVAVLPQFRMFGVTADVMLLVAVTTAIVAGPVTGAYAGFVCGLLADFFLQTPFGLSALTFCMVGWVVGVFQSRVLHAVWWIPVLTAALASAAGTVAFVLVGVVVGQDHLVSSRLPTIVGVTALWSAIFVLLVVRIVRWALQADSARAGLALR